MPAPDWSLPWPCCGSALDQLWIKCAPAVSQLWIRCGSNVSQLCPSSGSAVDQMWLSCGSALYQLWIRCGLALDELWPRCGCWFPGQCLWPAPPRPVLPAVPTSPGAHFQPSQSVKGGLEEQGGAGPCTPAVAMLLQIPKSGWEAPPQPCCQAQLHPRTEYFPPGMAAARNCEGNTHKGKGDLTRGRLF